MLFSVEVKFRRAKRHADHRREPTVEQLSLLELAEPKNPTPVWDLLDEEQRAEIVAMLARLMARAVTRTSEEEHIDE